MMKMYPLMILFSLDFDSGKLVWSNKHSIQLTVTNGQDDLFI